LGYGLIDAGIWVFDIGDNGGNLTNLKDQVMAMKMHMKL
jgi:hypothetical protein